MLCAKRAPRLGDSEASLVATLGIAFGYDIFRDLTCATLPPSVSCRKRPRSAWEVTPRRIVLDVRATRFRKAPAPAPHLIFGRTNLCRDLLVPFPVGRQQDNPATFRQAPRCQRTPERRLQPSSIDVGKLYRRGLALVSRLTLTAGEQV